MNQETRELRALVRQLRTLAADCFDALPCYMDGRFDRLERRLQKADKKTHELVGTAREYFSDAELSECLETR
jgi:hypothetical protein